jgi:hypothetical protein
MATLSNTNLTLLDRIKRVDPDGNEANIIEALTESNDILKDAVAMEGNLPTGHRTTVRSGLPSLTYRMINQGVAKSSSKTIQVDETCALLEGRSTVDCELVRLYGNGAAFRAGEDRAFVQAMGNQVAGDLFYSSTLTSPEQFHGWNARYASLTGDDNSSNVIDSGENAGPAVGGEQASIWFITWGENTASLIYPKGTMGGLTSEDLGKEYVTDSGGSNEYLAYRTHHTWRVGLCVKDWRYHVRICNIDTTDFSATSEALIDSMVQAYNRIYDYSSGRTVIYANRATVTMLDRQVMTKDNVWFSPVEWHGRQITGFRGIPIVRIDSLLSTEAVVS